MSDTPERTRTRIKVPLPEKYKECFDHYRKEQGQTWYAFYDEVLKQWIEWIPHRPSGWKPVEIVSEAPATNVELYDDVRSELEDIISDPDVDISSLSRAVWVAISHFVRTTDLFEMDVNTTPQTVHIYVLQEDLALLEWTFDSESYHSRANSISDIVRAWLDKHEALSAEEMQLEWREPPNQHNGTSYYITIEPELHERLKELTSRDGQDPTVAYYMALIGYILETDL